MARSGRRPSQRRWLLVVDAEARTRAFMVKALGARNDIAVAAHPHQAFDLLEGSSRRFDGVIVGCLLTGDLDHYRACIAFIRRMFDRWPWLPVIATRAARGAERLVGDVLVSGVREFVRTPFRARDLVNTVERVIVRRPDARPPGAARMATMKHVASILEECVSDRPPAVVELARMAGVSRSHFSRTFHAMFGMTIGDYVRDLRLKQAHELLLGSTLSVTAVAVDVGFYDLPHFDKVFRRRLGISPQQFRARYAEPSVLRRRMSR